MRILFYTDTPNIGGAEKQMSLLASELGRRGHAVSLAHGKYGKLSGQTRLLEAYEKVFPLRTVHKHDPRHFWELRRVLEAGNFDVLHIHLWNPGSARYAFFAAAEKVPILTTEHDPFELGGVKRWIKQKCLARTNHTLTISRANREAMMEWYGLGEEQVSTVHNGIDLTPFHPQGPRAKLPVNTGDIVLTCVAELHPRKGHKYLLEAFKKLQSSIPHLQLVLVGRGPAEEELRERVAREARVHFLGWREDVPAILRASDIFILPSLSEAFGLVVVEAMASGLPVIATRAGGVPEIIEKDKSGLLVPPASSSALAEAIKILIQNPDQCRDIKKAAVERAKQFEVSQMAEATERFYDSISSTFSSF